MTTMKKLVLVASAMWLLAIVVGMLQGCSDTVTTTEVYVSGCCTECDEVSECESRSCCNKRGGIWVQQDDGSYRCRTKHP